MPDPKPALAEPVTLYVSSFDELAAALGTTERQWRTYAKRAGFPAKVEGKGYDLKACAAWKAANVAGKCDGSLAAAKLEKTKAETRLLLLKEEREQKRSVSREAVDALHGKLAQRLRSFLYSKLENEMPPKIAGCDALTIRKYGRALADEIVIALKRDIDAWGADPQ